MQRKPQTRRSAVTEKRKEEKKKEENKDSSSVTPISYRLDIKISMQKLLRFYEVAKKVAPQTEMSDCGAEEERNEKVVLQDTLIMP